MTCVLPLGTVSSGRESEVESAHLFLTIIQFLSARHLTSQHTNKEKDKGNTFENWRMECAHPYGQCWVSVGRELGRYGIEIAALSETRFAEIGEIKEVKE